MRVLRAIFRIIAIFVWLAIITAVSIPYRFMGWRGRKKISYLQMLWLKGTSKIAGIRIRVHGKTEDLPAGLVVSNHLGYLDVLVHGSIFPCRFTSTKIIAGWPVIGALIRLGYPVLVDRTSKPASRQAMRDFVKTMKRGMYLIVYPEGTSTDGKNGILPFKSTSFEAAAFGDMPVIPILTRYRESDKNPTVCWYGDMTFIPHLSRILATRKIEADIYFMPAVYPEGRTRKELAEYVHEIMDNEYRKLTLQGASKNS